MKKGGLRVPFSDKFDLLQAKSLNKVLNVMAAKVTQILVRDQHVAQDMLLFMGFFSSIVIVAFSIKVLLYAASK